MRYYYYFLQQIHLTIGKRNSCDIYKRVQNVEKIRVSFAVEYFKETPLRTYFCHSDLKWSLLYVSVAQGLKGFSWVHK